MPADVAERRPNTESTIVLRNRAKYIVFVSLALGAGHTPQDPSLHRVHAITQT